MCSACLISWACRPNRPGTSYFEFRAERYGRRRVAHASVSVASSMMTFVLAFDTREGDGVGGGRYTRHSIVKHSFAEPLTHANLRCVWGRDEGVLLGDRVVVES